MDNNANNPKNETDRILGLNRTLFLVIAVMLCILSLCIGIYAQFFYKYSESDPFMFGFISKAKQEEEKEKLIGDFENIFTNEYKSANAVINAEKIEVSSDYVYTATVTNENIDEQYTIDAKIPRINLNTQAANEMNENIKQEFENEILAIKGSSEGYKVYNVNYIAYANEDLLSIAIKSTYYEQDVGTQTTKIKTYNYNLAANSKIDLASVMQAKGLTAENVQKEILNKLQALNDSDAELGYSSIQRKLDDDMYKIANTDTFLVNDEGDIYIIYNYGTKQDVLVY